MPAYLSDLILVPSLFSKERGRKNYGVGTMERIREKIKEGHCDQNILYGKDFSVKKKEQLEMLGSMKPAF